MNLTPARQPVSLLARLRNAGHPLAFNLASTAAVVCFTALAATSAHAGVLTGASVMGRAFEVSPGGVVVNPLRVNGVLTGLIGVGAVAAAGAGVEFTTTTGPQFSFDVDDVLSTFTITYLGSTAAWAQADLQFELSLPDVNLNIASLFEISDNFSTPNGLGWSGNRNTTRSLGFYLRAWNPADAGGGPTRQAVFGYEAFSTAPPDNNVPEPNSLALAVLALMLAAAPLAARAERLPNKDGSCPSGYTKAADSHGKAQCYSPKDMEKKAKQKK